MKRFHGLFQLPGLRAPESFFGREILFFSPLKLPFQQGRLTQELGSQPGILLCSEQTERTFSQELRTRIFKKRNSVPPFLWKLTDTETLNFTIWGENSKALMWFIGYSQFTLNFYFPHTYAAYANTRSLVITHKLQYMITYAPLKITLIHTPEPRDKNYW